MKKITKNGFRRIQRRLQGLKMLESKDMSYLSNWWKVIVMPVLEPMVYSRFTTQNFMGVFILHRDRCQHRLLLGSVSVSMSGSVNAQTRSVRWLIEGVFVCYVYPYWILCFPPLQTFNPFLWNWWYLWFDGKETVYRSQIKVSFRKKSYFLCSGKLN